MVLAELKFRSVFDREDALITRNKAGQNVQQGGFTGACTTRNYDIYTG